MYDVIIIGGGVSGVFAAYRLSQFGKKVLVIDQGHDLSERVTLLADDPSQQFRGFGGLGLSEGKYNYSVHFGGNLADKIGTDRCEDLMRQVDRILCLFGAKNAVYYQTDDAQLNLPCRQAGLQMLATSVRHLGTQKSRDFLTALRIYLSDKIDFLFNCRPESIVKSRRCYQMILPERTVLTARRVIIAVGGDASDWLAQVGADFSINEGAARLDMGIRIEMPYRQWQAVLSKNVETKLRFEHLGRVATTYCMNPGGAIIRKYHNGLVMSDGQNCRELGAATENLNFTLFIREMFDTRRSAFDFAAGVISAINRGSDRIVVQRLDDVIHQRASTETDLMNGTVRPSLSASPGQLSEEVPPHYLAITLEFLRRLSALIGEPVDGDSLLYGIEAKFFAPEKVVSAHFETEIAGLFLIGDCSGVTGSLSQAAASGLQAADHIVQTMN
jgi:uncharacterized FAD-dependent dehydrogenase